MAERAREFAAGGLSPAVPRDNEIHVFKITERKKKEINIKMKKS